MPLSLPRQVGYASIFPPGDQLWKNDNQAANKTGKSWGRANLAASSQYIFEFKPFHCDSVLLVAA